MNTGWIWFSALIVVLLWASHELHNFRRAHMRLRHGIELLAGYNAATVKIFVQDYLLVRPPLTWPSAEEMYSALAKAGIRVENAVSPGAQESVLVSSFNTPNSVSLSGRTVVFIGQPGQATVQTFDRTGATPLVSLTMPLPQPFAALKSEEPAYN